MTSSPCIKQCVCWEFLDKRCVNVSSAERSKLFMSGADAKKGCASRSSALNPTSLIKLHKLGCSMKHHPTMTRRPCQRRAQMRTLDQRQRARARQVRGGRGRGPRVGKEASRSDRRQMGDVH